MYIDRDINAEEYPFHGTFYINGEETLPDDGDLFGGTSISEETIVLETECDVTETSRSFSAGAITASYDVYFPHIGDTIIDKGTDGGGAIEVYANVEDAESRNEYLAGFDGGVLASGSHIVVGTCVVRTSDELAASKQKELEAAVIEALTKLE